MIVRVQLPLEATLIFDQFFARFGDNIVQNFQLCFGYEKLECLSDLSVTETSYKLRLKFLCDLRHIVCLCLP